MLQNVGNHDWAPDKKTASALVDRNSNVELQHGALIPA
jgi:hypothetical protein